MDDFTEAEIQLLIMMLNLSEAGQKYDSDALRQFGADYFRRYQVDWTDAYSTLCQKGLLRSKGSAYGLTERGRLQAGHVRAARPPFWYWYTDYYAATQGSRAYATFCERVFGRNFAQHGFSDMMQIARMIEVTALGPQSRVLELGCGSGAMAEYISDTTGAHVTGIDFIPEAIKQARERAVAKPNRLCFEVMDIAALDFPPASFDTILSIDTLYFTHLDTTLRQLKTLLVPGGQMAIFYGLGADPRVPIEFFPTEFLPPDRTPLGVALQRACLAFQTWDFSEADYQHALLKRQVLEELRPAFEAEDNMFLFDSRWGDSNGMIAAYEAGAHARYLYHVCLES